MTRSRALLIVAVIAIGVLGGAINARGPFADHPTLTYPQLIADVGAGHVGIVSQWRDRLEVTEGSHVFLVTVPAGADAFLEVSTARLGGGAALGFERIPDDWLAISNPGIPALMLIVGVVIWVPAVRRWRDERRVSTGPALG